jgi:hypothetical protein
MPQGKFLLRRRTYGGCDLLVRHWLHDGVVYICSVSATTLMRFKVYLLRHRGRRLSWREVKNGRSYVGTLITHVETHGGEQYNVLCVAPSGPMSTDVPPPLYEPVLLGFAPLAIRLRGFERVGGAHGGQGVVQEWHVEEP